MVNDTHGHAAGDRVPRSLADLITRHVRNIDMVSRICGEELVVVLLDTNAAGAGLVAQRLLKRVA